MSNLGVMQKGVQYTTNAYIKAYDNKGLDNNQLIEQATQYSARTLYDIVTGQKQLITNYTRKNNLRFAMANLGTLGIKAELLKNMIDVSLLRLENNQGAQYLGELKPDNTYYYPDYLNNLLSSYDTETAFLALEDQDVLFESCLMFCRANQPPLNQQLEAIRNNNLSKKFHNEIDTYYVRNESQDYGGKHY